MAAFRAGVEEDAHLVAAEAAGAAKMLKNQAQFLNQQIEQIATRIKVLEEK